MYTRLVPGLGKNIDCDRPLRRLADAEGKQQVRSSDWKMTRLLTTELLTTLHIVAVGIQNNENSPIVSKLATNRLKEYPTRLKEYPTL